MDVPAEIKSLLGDAAPTAFATLSCGLQSPIGETALVVTDGRLHAFTRESFISGFAAVALDAAHPPRLERGDFSDTLFLAGADGDVWQLNVSSFERENLTEVLAALTTPAPSAPPRDFTPEQDTEALQTRAEDLLSKFEAMAESPAQAPVDRTPPEHALRPQASEPVTGEAEDTPDPPKVAARYKGASLYHGSDMPLEGCLAQLALFVGGILFLWHAHDLAFIELLALLPMTDDLTEVAYVISKIMAVVAGAYLGGRLAGVVSRWARGGRKLGYIEFEGNRLICAGQKSAWTIEFDLNRPIVMLCHVEQPTTNTSENSTTPVKRTFNFQVRLSQSGRECVIRSHEFRVEHWLGVKGLNTQLVSELPAATQSIRMDADVVRLVLKRIRDTNRAQARR